MVSQNDAYFRRLASQYFPPPTATYQPPPTAAQPALQTAPAPEEEDEGFDVVGKVFGGLGKAVDVGGKFLDLSGKYAARPIQGAVMQALASDNPAAAALRTAHEKVSGLPSYDIGPLAIGPEMAGPLWALSDNNPLMRMLMPDSEEERERIQDADSFTAALKEAGMDEAWYDKLILEVVADPTTWITAGTVGVAAKVLPMSVRTLPKVAAAIRAAETGAGLAERVQALPLTAPIDLARRGLNRLPGDLLKESPRSKLITLSETSEAALRRAQAAGVETLARPRGLGFSSQTGAEGLRESQRIADARVTQQRLLGPNKASWARRIKDLTDEEVFDLYETVDPADPLYTAVRNRMMKAGYVTRTRPGGTTGPWQYTTDTQRVEGYRQQREMLRNDPSNPMAEPTNDISNVSEFVSQNLIRAGEAPKQQQLVETLLSQIEQANPTTFSAKALWIHPETNLDLAKAMSANSEREARFHMSNMSKRIGAMHSSSGMLHPHGIIKFMDGLLPDIQKTRDDISLPTVGGYARFNSVVSDEQQMALETMMRNPAVMQEQAAYEKAFDDLATRINGKTTITLSDSTTARDLYEASKQLTDAKDIAAVKKFMNDYSMTEEAVNKYAIKNYKQRVTKSPGDRSFETFKVADAWTDNMMDVWIRDQAKELGVDLKNVDKAWLGPRMRWIPKAWREQALISPRYHLTNFLDMSAKSLLYGVNPLRNLGASDTAKSVGITTLPRGVFVGDETTNIRQVLQPEEFAGATYKSVLPGPLGGISRFNRGLARATENAFREWAWANGLKDGLHAYKPILHSQIRQMMGAKGDPLISQLEKTGHRVNIKGKDTFFARDQGIRFSPDDLRTQALNHGATPEQANLLARQWQDAVSQSADSGVVMANKVHFDFDKTFNIEDRLFLKKWLPFHFFATRNIPFYMETFANRPELVNAWMAYNNLSEQDQIGIGLPDRFKGMVPVGDNFIQSLLGPNKMYFNPMAMLSYLDQMKNTENAFAERPWESDTKLLSRPTVGRILERAGALGIGNVAPWVQIPLSVAGAYGPEDETMNVLRVSGLTEALPEPIKTDFGESQFRSFLNEARALTHGGQRVETQTGSQQKDRLIIARMQETMQSLINKGADPTATRKMFTDASKEGPGNVLWDRAQNQVQGDELSNQFRNFWFPLPAKTTTEQGLQNISAREALPESIASNDQMVDFLKRIGDPAVANRGFRTPGLVDREGNRIWDNNGKPPEPKMKESEYLVWGGPVWGPDKPPPYNTYFNFETYTKWRGSAPGSANSPEDFFTVYNIR